MIDLFTNASAGEHVLALLQAVAAAAAIVLIALIWHLTAPVDRQDEDA